MVFSLLYSFMQNYNKKTVKKTIKTPNSYFSQKVLLKINELEARNSDFSFCKKCRNWVGTSLFVEVGAVF